MNGFVRVGAAVLKLKVANVGYNVDEIIKIVKEANEKQVSLLVFR